MVLGHQMPNCQGFVRVMGKETFMALNKKNELLDRWLPVVLTKKGSMGESKKVLISKCHQWAMETDTIGQLEVRVNLTILNKRCFR